MTVRNKIWLTGLILLGAFIIFQIIQAMLSIDRVGWYNAHKKVVSNDYLNLFNDTSKMLIASDCSMINKIGDTVSVFNYQEKYSLIVYRIRSYDGIQMSNVKINVSDKKDSEISSGGQTFPVMTKNRTIDMSVVHKISSPVSQINISIKADSISSFKKNNNLICNNINFRKIYISSKKDDDYDIILGANSRNVPDLSVNSNFAIKNFDDKFYILLLYPTKDGENLLKDMLK